MHQMKTMMTKSYASILVLILMVTIAVASETYFDYGDEPADRNLENLREFYRMLLRRNSVENPGLGGNPLEHLMIRKSQRSPSLRLRFGRSGPVIPTGIFTRPGSSSSALDDN